MIYPSRLPRNRNEAVVLLIVLAFLVLLTGLVVAYFSRTTTDRQLAKSSSGDTLAGLLARSALDIVVADFQQEIANGATITNSNVVPQRSPSASVGSTPAIPNLIRRSVRADTIVAPAVGSRASAVNSTTDISLNGRSVTFARWNAHYLIPKANTGDTLSDPITPTTGGFTAPNYWAPDWVVVTRAGPTVFNSWNATLTDPKPSNASFAVGRYAFAVYDEGGLLDANMVGLPSPTPAITEVGRKGNVAFADLTGMKLSAAGTTAAPNTYIPKFVAWRNYATMQSSGTFPALTCPANPSATFTNYFLDTSRDFRTVASTVYNGDTDQAFLTRQELIDLWSGVSGSYLMLQFLGTFSRETNKPTWGTFVTTRFPLSRFDLFANTTSPPDSTKLQSQFGLQYVPAAGAAKQHYNYIGTSGAARLSTIPSISTTTTDTDLPSLLKYALPSGTSVGEILSIEASLIDQRDSDTDTTWIEYGPTGPAQIAFGVDSIGPASTPLPTPALVSAPVFLNRAFRNVGELGYAYRNGTTTLDFQTATSGDAPLLDLFTYNTAPVRAGIVNLNTNSVGVIAALLRSAIISESASTAAGLAMANNAAASPTPVTTTGVLGGTSAGKEGTWIKPALGRQEITRLVAAAGNTLGAGQEAKQAVARALAEVTQTRTWGLFIDVVAQTGKYPPSATGLSQFVVEGEKRYWLHIAIDRFTGQIVDQQLEPVFE